MVENQSLLRDGLTVGQFVGMTTNILEKMDIEPEIRKILEVELDRAKRHSPFSTLTLEYDIKGKLYLSWTTNVSFDPNDL